MRQFRQEPSEYFASDKKSGNDMVVVAILSISFPLVEVDDGRILVLLTNLFLISLISL